MNRPEPEDERGVLESADARAAGYGRLPLPPKGDRMTSYDVKTPEEESPVPPPTDEPLPPDDDEEEEEKSE